MNLVALIAFTKRLPLSGYHLSLCRAISLHPLREVSLFARCLSFSGQAMLITAMISLSIGLPLPRCGKSAALVIRDSRRFVAPILTAAIISIFISGFSCRTLILADGVGQCHAYSSRLQGQNVCRGSCIGDGDGQQAVDHRFVVESTVGNCCFQKNNSHYHQSTHKEDGNDA